MSDPIEEVRERLRSLISQVAALAADGRGADSRLPLAAHAMRQAMEILARPDSSDTGEIKRTPRSLASLITPIGSTLPPSAGPDAGPVRSEASRPAGVPATDPRPASVLTAIRGIDRDLAGQLSAHGVRSAGDIAAWRAEDVARIARALDLGRRISKENWIEQAALIARRDASMTAVAGSALDSGGIARADKPSDAVGDREIAPDRVAAGDTRRATVRPEDGISGSPAPVPAPPEPINAGPVSTGQPDRPLPNLPEATAHNLPSPISSKPQQMASDEAAEAEVTIVKRTPPSNPRGGARSTTPILRQTAAERPKPPPRPGLTAEKSSPNRDASELPGLEAEVVILPPRNLLPGGPDPTPTPPRNGAVDSRARHDTGHGATSDEAAGKVASSSNATEASGAVARLLGRLRGEQNGRSDRRS